jgi:hypothetical protein
MGGKQDGTRVAICEEYVPKENKFKTSDIMLSSAKSGFGTVCKHGI